MLYTAKCYWPGVDDSAVRAAVGRAAGEHGERSETVFRGALYLPGDELVLCLFDSGSRSSVKRASELAGMPCERVIDTVWIDPLDAKGEPPCEG